MILGMRFASQGGNELTKEQNLPLDDEFDTYGSTPLLAAGYSLQEDVPDLSTSNRYVIHRLNHTLFVENHI